MGLGRFDILIAPNASRVQKVCFIIIDAIQHLRKEDHVVSLAVLWLMMCERFDIKPHEVLTVADNIMKETIDQGHRQQLKALKEYMKNELK